MFYPPVFLSCFEEPENLTVPANLSFDCQVFSMFASLRFHPDTSSHTEQTGELNDRQLPSAV